MHQSHNKMYPTSAGENGRHGTSMIAGSACADIKNY